jgi:farnesyl diphosphate synthase
MNLQPHLSNPVTEQEAEIAAWRARFEERLDQQLPDAGHDPSVLHQSMRYSALAAGKRFRPILVYASGKALGLEPSSLDDLACAIEIIHAYSLIHDDLPAMDDDDLRRGRPTCHRAFNEATAILAGDALQALAFEIMANAYGEQGETGMNMILSLARACGSRGMAGGQSLDLNAVGKNLALAELENMHRLKTGALITASVTLPAMLADADSELTSLFAAYGDCVGLAFQVHDDILDVTGDSALTGKPTLADAALNKPTFPSIIGLEQSREQASRLKESAIGHLADIPGDTSTLEWLADYVISRDR